MNFVNLSQFNISDDVSKIKHNIFDTVKNMLNKKDNIFAKKNKNENIIELSKKFNSLAKQFNETSSQNEQIKLVKDMRIIMGKVVKLFFNDIKQTEQNIDEEKYYNLSILDSNIVNMRKVINDAEKVIIDDNTTNSHNQIIKKTLNKKNFNIDIPTMILFYSNGCGFCKQFKPIWDEFVDKNNNLQINLVETDDNVLMNKYEISGVPTIKYIDGNKIIEYNGSRTEDGLLKFVKSMSNKIETNKIETNKIQTKAENHNTIIKRIVDNIKINVDNPTIILFYSDNCSHCKTFKPIWNEFERITDRKYMNVIKTNNNDLMQQYKINSIPTVKFIDNNNSIINYENNRTVEDLANFVNSLLKKEVSKPITMNKW
jgi:thiol-disulfide isomerase/thioredoxin